MSPVQTLFEYTNSIVSDSQALSDFQADPTGVLNAAGLDNVTANVNTTVHQASGTVDGLLGNLPVAGPLVTAGMTVLNNAVGGVAVNEANGTLVSSAADAVSNHLLDSALVSTLNDTLNHD